MQIMPFNVSLGSKIAVSTVVATTIFITDFLTPLGIAAAVPYVIFVLLSLWINIPKSALYLAIVATILTLLGWGLSPVGGEPYKVLLNRTYALVAIWVVGISLYHNLKSKQLVLAQKMDLEFLNKELEMFSYSVSHDLKAPLRALQGFSKNLYKEYADTLDETGNRWLKFINDNAHAMDVLINDILGFSRINRQEMKSQEIDMTTLANDIAKREQQAYKQKIELEIENLPEAWGDRSMIELVWQNLIGNAFKYSSHKDIIQIKISGYANKSNNHYVIADQGAGFDMKYYDKLFGVFQRLHKNDEFEGSGIGLANVNRIVQKHGGTISAKGEITQGATFEFTLPKHS